MKNISITIEYKFINSSEWHNLEFSPDEYFDLDPDENVEWDCVPFYNHAIDYLDVDKSIVQYTRETIIDLKAGVTSIATETFWNNGENRIITTNTSGNYLWKETIIEIKLQDYPPTWEILRYAEKENQSVLSYHGLITDNEDGSQDEKIIYQN
jgi:hypothetical protein